MNFDDENNNIYRPPEQTIKYSNTLELLETEKLIRQIECKMGGYIEVKKDGQPYYKRVDGLRPYFADDFIHMMTQHLTFYSNIITSQNEWTKKEINIRLRHSMRNLIVMMAGVGNDHFISQNSYQEILAIDRNKKIQEFTFLDKNNVKQKGTKLVSGWYEYINRDWNEDSPISRVMLTKVKIPYESADQWAIMGLLQSDIYIFLEGALRRSMNALTLKHHQSTTQTHRHEFKDDRPKSAIQSVGQSIQGGQ